MMATVKLNYFPAKHRVSKYYSSRMILHCENLDYKKHTKFVIGEYVQGDNDINPTNTNEAHILDCLYL